MAVEIFDSHSYVKKLCSAGVSEKEAEAHVSIQMSILRGQLASKADLLELRSDVKADIHELTVRIEKLNYDLTVRMAAMLVGMIGVMGAMFKFFN